MTTMQRSGSGVSAGFLAALVPVLERAGLPAHALREALGAAGDGVRDGDLDSRIVPGERVDALIDALAERCRAPSLGVVLAHSAPLGSLGFLDYCAAASTTLRDALARTTRFYGLLTDRVRLVLEIQGEEAHLVQRSRPGVLANRHLREFSAALMTLRAQQLCGDAFAPTYVRFTHQAPTAVEPYAALFGVTPCFAAPCDEIVFARALLDLPVQSADAVVVSLIERHASALAAQRDSADPFDDRLRATIVAGLERGVDVDACARALHVSRRTLQRRLRARETTFSAIVDDVRRAAALEALRSSSAPVSHLAFRLGFHDLSSFHRAFRRWTGTTPRAYRYGERS